MTAIFKRNEDIGLVLLQFSGSIQQSELAEIMQFQAASPDLAVSDALNIIEPDARFGRIPPEALDPMRQSYRRLYQPIAFQLVRRSAWICRNPAALAPLERWLRGRSARDGLNTAPRICGSMEEAGAWLLLSPEELADVAAERGFREIARFDAKPPEPGAQQAAPH